MDSRRSAAAHQRRHSPRRKSAVYLLRLPLNQMSRDTRDALIYKSFSGVSKQSYVALLNALLMATCYIQYYVSHLPE